MKAIHVYLVIFLLTVSTAFAQDLTVAKPESVGMSSERLAMIKPFMEKHVDEARLAGVVTLIARHGKIVHFEKIGKLNVETGQEIERDSLFRIYSMTKPVVSVGLMKLYEQGRFQLDDPVSKYLPEFENTNVLVDGKEVEQDHPFTIRELLSHTAGLTYGFFSDTAVDQHYTEAALWESRNIAAFTDKLSKIPLQYQPGTRWHYSVAVDVTGRLIEVISGRPLDQYLYDEIFKPLGMDDTFFEVPHNKLARFGTNHQQHPETGELEVVDRPDASSTFVDNVTFFSGGGGLVSTAMDYLRFCQALLNGGELHGQRILGPKTVELMTTNHLADGVTPTWSRPEQIDRFGFGLGFAVTVDQPTGTVGSIGEYSWGGAAGTVFWIDPREDLIGIVMVQMMKNPVPLRGQFRALTYSAIIGE